MFLGSSAAAQNQPPGNQQPGNQVPGGRFPGGRFPGVAGPGNNTSPPQEYFIALEFYRSGELDRALDGFDVALRRTRVDVTGRWIDSIPVYAMLAETQYQLGDLESAMRSLDELFTIVARNRGWMARPLWRDLNNTGNVAVTPPRYLWPAARTINRIPLPGEISFVRGQVIDEATIAAGGAIESQNIRRLNVVEVLRGIAIANYRRRIIMGELASLDSGPQQSLEATKFPAGLNVPIARVMIGAMRGCERFGAGQDEMAVKDSVQFGLLQGRIHPLTPIANLASASAVAGTDKPEQALQQAIAAANQAGADEQLELVGEAMMLAAGCSNAQTAKAVQTAAGEIAAALIRESRLASAQCLLASVDAAITAGDLNYATQRLQDAGAMLSRRDMVVPRLRSYMAYLSARLATRQPYVAAGNPTPWQDPLGAMFAFATDHQVRNRGLISMPRLYQLARLNQIIASTKDTGSIDDLLATYADAPSIAVWRRDATDALAGQVANRDSLRVARLSTALARNNAPDAMLRIEQLQQGRITQPLALGGRVLQANAVARMPGPMLLPKDLQWRNTADGSVRNLSTALLASANQPKQQIAPEQAATNYGKLISQTWAVALDRNEIPTVVPKQLDEKKPLGDIPEKTGLLIYLRDGGFYHAILATKDKATAWSIKGGPRIDADIAELLRTVGVGQKKKPRLPTDEAWRQQAMGLRDRLIPPDTGPILQGVLANVERLVVIPDSRLWYLPFELLPTDDQASELLGDALSLSYAATPALALSPTAAPPQDHQIGISLGRFFAPRDMQHDAAIAKSITDVLPAKQWVDIPNGYAIPSSRSGEVATHLIVGQITAPKAGALLRTALIPSDTSQPLGAFEDWLGPPPRVPNSVFLSGFRCYLDTGQQPLGSEIMATIAQLQYSGVRDVVLSRWALGGQSTATLIQEYGQELPFAPALEAFDRARQILRGSDLDPAGEPTLLGDDLDGVMLSGDQPFFWSSYLISTPLN